MCLHELRRLVCVRGHGVVLLHASGSVAHDIDGTASVCVIGTQSVSCEPLNIERKRTACVPASGIKRIVANHSKRIIARTPILARVPGIVSVTLSVPLQRVCVCMAVAHDIDAHGFRVCHGASASGHRYELRTRSARTPVCET